MPRKSIQALAIVPPVSGGAPRLDPPAGLSEPARRVFLEIVTALDPKHFGRGDMPLLVAYCTACEIERQAAEALGREGPVVDGRANPWNLVMEKATRSMVALSLRLRLSPQSRIDSRAAGRSAGKPGPRGIEALTGISDE